MKKIFFLLITSITIIVSCKKEKFCYYLTAQDKLWNIYHEGDTIKFLSNYIKKMNYCVTGIEQEVIAGSTGINNYEHIIINFQRTDSIYEHNEFILEIVRGYPGDPRHGFMIIMWSYGFDLRLPNPFDLISQSTILDTLKVNNIIYNNVLKFTNPYCDTISSVANSVYYNMQKGWLRIKRNSGEIWDRVN